MGEKISAIFIGDPHVQVSNIPEVDIFIERLLILVNEKKPDFIVVGGDLLHTHERLHTIALNKAYELVDKLRQITKTYVLVGNHDMCNNQQFLTDNHWMNGMKDWNNIVIVDQVCTLEYPGQTFVFCPYTPPGRFAEALDTIGPSWINAKCIFAHQEFAGCKMGAIVSIEGDKWPTDYPEVVSGHIHSRQIPQPNIYYTGSAMQHAFGESEKNIIAYLEFNPYTPGYTREEIDLELPRKKIVYVDVQDLDEYNPPVTQDKLKVTVSGSYDEFKALKKTRKYKELLDTGVKVVFKPKKIRLSKNEEAKSEEPASDVRNQDFVQLLNDMILEQKNKYLVQAYELVVNSKQIEANDMMFL